MWFFRSGFVYSEKGMMGPEGGIEFAKFFYDLSVVPERDSPELVGRSI